MYPGSMEVRSFVPQNPLLRDHIECFYTLKRSAEEADDVYITFPNVFPILSLHKQAKIEVIRRVRTLSHCSDSEVESNLICHFPRFERIRYCGQTDEICVYFKPLGINAFLTRELSYYAKSPFAELMPFNDYRSRMSKIFSIGSSEQRIHALEKYWISKYVGFQHPFLAGAVDEIMKNDPPSSLSAMAERLGISRTTLVKHFNLHLCTTPSHFKKIARFRNAMNLRRFRLSNANLTAVSQSAEYFDHSHMIKDFKSLTSFAPKSFFSNISSLENGRINWIFQ
jgi:AraC-like DNA-binding protein